MRGHDFEEFAEIVERWGFWNPTLFRSTPAFKKALQLDLGLDLELKTSDGRVVAVPAELLALSEAPDRLLGAACKIALRYPAISVSLLERELHIGYLVAGRLLDQMEELGVIGQAGEHGMHEVLGKPEEETTNS